MTSGDLQIANQVTVPNCTDLHAWEHEVHRNRETATACSTSIDLQRQMYRYDVQNDVEIGVTHR